jgi:uncharacterized ferritin-like protein (DUF455 family)
MNARRRALDVLLEPDPATKVAATCALYAALTPDAIDPTLRLSAPAGLPGRPDRPVLVAATAVPTRTPFTLEGRAALLHAIAHIEFNAINLALDACWRFADLPAAYYVDWLKVAAEEAQHFTLLSRHLQGLGSQYGDFPAHPGLWDMVEKTRGDVLARMALVPRTLEARGLDASPPLRAKLARAGDHGAAGILDVILRDEIGHVAIGNHWYRWLCEQRALDPVATYARLAREFDAPRLRAPFNLDARRRAGFTEAELDTLRCG